MALVTSQNIKDAVGAGDFVGRDPLADLLSGAVTQASAAAFVAQLSTGGSETNANICTAINAVLTMLKANGQMASA